MQFYLPLLLLVQVTKPSICNWSPLRISPSPSQYRWFSKLITGSPFFIRRCSKKISCAPFHNCWIFLIYPRTHTKRPLYKVSPSFTYSFIFLSKIFFLFLGSAYTSSAITCEEIRIRVRLNPRPTKQTIKRAKKHAEFFNDIEVFVLLFSDSPV